MTENNKFYCKVPNCGKVVLLKGIARHLFSHGLTYESYAWKYHTDEIVRCPICNNEYFRKKSSQYRGLDLTCGKKQCIYILQQITTRKTLLDKYGVDHIMKIPEIKQKQIDSFSANHNGATCNFVLPENRIKLVERLKEIGHYETVAKKALVTKKERGSDKIGAEKQKKTKASNPRKYKEAARRAVKTREKNGNIPAKKAAITKKQKGFYEYDKSQERIAKGFQTQKRNGTLGKKISNGEIAFSCFLDFYFSKDFFIFWQTKINSEIWNDIYGNLFSDFNKQLEPDFIIIHKETLQPIIVCFDGIFIHGLDRPITEIARKALVSKFNANIFNKYYSDRSFEEYCQKRNINLIRFDENSFEDFLFDNKKLEPYFTCGASKVIDQFLFMLHK